MKKVKILLIALSIVLLILIIGGVIIYNLFFKTNTNIANLNNFTGSVEINRFGKIINAKTGLKLKNNDIIITKNNSTADIILFDSIYVQIEENTKISIESLKLKNIKLKQDKGKTWTKFSNIVGIESFEFETPNSVATIRGTEFNIDVNDEEIISLIEGDLEVFYNNEKHKLNPFTRFKIKDGNYSISEFTYEEKIDALTKIKNNIKILKNIRNKELKNKETIINQVRKKYNLHKDLESYLNDIDNGIINDKELVKYSPIQTSLIDKLLRINEDIKKTNWIIKCIEEKQTSEYIKNGLLNKSYLRFNFN